MKLKKTLSGVLAVTTLLLGSLSTLGSANAYSIETNDTPKASTSSMPKSSGTAMEKDYGLAPSIQQGAILHAFCWDFDTIKNNMELIAQSGYTAVQTSPVSFCYDDYPDKTLLAEDSKKYDGTAGAWWWHYQPTALTVGNYQLGDDTKYAQMCAEADKYGVKIITDIVANHTTSHYKKNSSGEEVTGLGIDADACGSCIINISSSNVSLSGKETDMVNGTYIDIVSGMTVKVSDSHFERGNVAANSIAVIYQAPTLDATYASESFTDTIDVTPTIINGGSVTTGTYTVNVDGTKINSGSFTSGQAITIGSNITVDSGFKDIDFVISADINGKTIGKTFSFVKRAQSDITYAYIDTTGRGWGNNLYAYVYGKTAEGESVKNSNWPGKPMTIDSGAVYKYEVPHDLKNGYVIFNDGTNQYPASGGFCLNGNSMILTKLNEWTAYKNTAIIDDDFNTYNYIYFFNSFGWWGTVTANFTDGANSYTIQMEMSNDLHCYYCKYPVNRNYTSVSFKVGAHTTSNALLKDNSGTNNAGKIYVPQADGGQWILASSLVEHTVYFEVTTSKWTNANAYMWRSADDNLTFQNTAFPGESMTQCYQNGNTHVYKYTYYYPQTTDNINDYEKVIFYSPAASAQTTNLSISTSTEGKLYKYTRTGTVDSEGHFLANISEVTSSKNLQVTIEYTNHKISESDDVEDYSVESNKFFKTTVDVTNGNISYAIADACDELGMTNVYDKYTLYGSQFGYVSKMASLADDRLEHNVPYSAYINPNVLSRLNDAFSAIYSNSSTYISELRDCANNPKWITLYDTSGKEIDYSLINPDLSNLGSIKLYAFSKPKLYNVKFYYPTIKSPSTNISFNNNSLVTENSVFESYESRYNLLLSNATRDIEENMKVPTGKVFDGWYKIEWKGQSSAVASFLKISSEDEYKYRITDDCVFYAAFRDEKAEPPENKATAISNPVAQSHNKTDFIPKLEV